MVGGIESVPDVFGDGSAVDPQELSGSAVTALAAVDEGAVFGGHLVEVGFCVSHSVEQGF
jgi:hypothetical protein